MKVLQIHNRYQIAGGEDVVVESERALLRSHGHEVECLAADNREIASIAGRLQAAGRVIYSPAARRQVRERLAQFRPNVMHVHNFFPLLSPSVYLAASDAGVPVVQTLHNYRLICPNALCFRDGHACEDCVGKLLPWPGVAHACYRRSRSASAAVAAMLTAHRLARTWERKVGRFIALTEFARERFVAGGLPSAKLAVKPNFVFPDPGRGSGRGGYALYVGRLSEEKGLGVLWAAWDKLRVKVPLKVVGDGPLSPPPLQGVELLGRRPREEVFALLREAALLVFPSVCYETFGLTIVESFAAGTPVVASNLGAMAAMVEHGRNGWLFAPGDRAELARTIEQAWPQTDALRAAARAEYEAKYTAQRNYELLMDIYRQVI